MIASSQSFPTMKKRGFFKRHAMRISLSLAVIGILLLHTVGVLNLGFVQSVENYAYDARLRLTMPDTGDPRVVIVDVDEKSLQQQGHWPWPRNQLANMVNKLFDQYQIKVLGFDMLFAEHDNSSGLNILERLEHQELRDNEQFSKALDHLRPQLRYDDLFARSLKNRLIVMGYFFTHSDDDTAEVGVLPEPAIGRDQFSPGSVGAMNARGYYGNLPQFQDAALAGGFFNASPLVESDGVFRRISLLQMYKGNLYETLSLAVARLALQAPPVKPGYSLVGAHALETLQLGNQSIPVDAQVGAWIPFRGRQRTFQYVSASDVLQGKADPEILRDAIVLVGTTATGLNDVRTVPVQESYAGVEVHANMVSAILDGNIKALPAYTNGLEAGFILALGIALALALPTLMPLPATLLSAGAMALMVLCNLYFWQFQQLILPLASSLILVSALFVLNMSYGFFVDSRAKRLLAHLFGQYVPPELVDEMAQDPGAYSLKGEGRELTVLFSDVRGFTHISEGLKPNQLTQLMNAYLTPMTHVIHRHRGTIDKYMGDAIMAFWGAPVSDPQHARSAVLAALDMVAELATLQEQFKAHGWPPIAIGVGVNTGEMTVGNMGSEFRLAYTVMGDAVNLGSRLESLTKQYGVDIIVSEFTRNGLTDFTFRELDCVRVKGKDKPVRIYEPLGLTERITPAVLEHLAAYDRALALYRSQHWEAAQAAFDALRAKDPNRKLYQIYMHRILHFANQPPPEDWDGVYTFETK